MPEPAATTLDNGDIVCGTVAAEKPFPPRESFPRYIAVGDGEALGTVGFHRKTPMFIASKGMCIDAPTLRAIAAILDEAKP